MNNPLMYVDENGEFWHIIIGALVGGVINLIANWDNVDGFWDGLATFGVGAGTGALVATTGGAGAGFWAVAGVSAGGGAIMGATNNIVAQTGQNFSGFGEVDWGKVWTSAGISGVAGFAGGATGYWAANASILVNNVNSPILRSAVVSPIAAGAGHVAGGTTAGLLQGQSFGEALENSFEGVWGSMAMGLAIGVTTTIAVSYANGINPVTGRELNNQQNISKWNYGDHKSQAKWENQMKQRGWNEQQINEAILFGKPYPAINNINLNNGATRYVHPSTGRSIVIDNVTGNILHIGGDGFLY
jgi:hypothetical protein